MLKVLMLWVATATTVRDCSSGTSVFKFLTASLTPDPVVKGQDATLSLSCQIPDGVTVTGGTAQYGFTFNGIPFSPTTEDLCSQVACPLVPGLYSNSTTTPFPDVSGKIITTIKWFDETKRLLYCLETTVKT
jgi:ML domain